MTQVTEVVQKTSPPYWETPKDIASKSGETQVLDRALPSRKFLRSLPGQKNTYFPYRGLPPGGLPIRKLSWSQCYTPFAGLSWVWEFPWVWVWDGYGDYDESPWVCGDSMGIFEWIPNYVETS